MQATSNNASPMLAWEGAHEDRKGEGIENLNTIDPKGPWRVLGKFLKKKGEDYTGIELDFDNEHTDDTSAPKENVDVPEEA